MFTFRAEKFRQISTTSKILKIFARWLSGGISLAMHFGRKASFGGCISVARLHLADAFRSQGFICKKLDNYAQSNIFLPQTPKR